MEGPKISVYWDDLLARVLFSMILLEDLQKPVGGGCWWNWLA